MFDLVKELEDKNIRVSLKENNLEISFDGDLDSEILNKLKENKERLIYFLSKYSEAYKGIKTIGVLQNYPISHAQKRLWIQSQIEENSKVYNLCNQIELNEDYDINVLEAAVLNVIKRHEVLRTIFKLNDDGEIRQWILSDKDLRFKVNHIDFSNEKESYQEVIKYIQKDKDTIFDLENGPLFRVSFLKLTDTNYIFYYNMHHIITDGWSLTILERDLFAFYESIKSKTKCNLEDLQIQYKDYAAWQLSAIEAGTYKKHKNYWTQKLSGNLPRLDLPSSKTRPKDMTYNGHVLRTFLSPEMTSKIKIFSKEKGGSLFMGLLTVFKILLSKYTSQQDVIIGTSVAGREDSALENQIGFYVNTLVLRNEINPENSLVDLFESVKKSTLEGFLHQIYPFDLLVTDLNLSRNLSRNFVFDCMIIFHNTGNNNKDIRIDENDSKTNIDLGLRKTNFDIEFEFQEIGKGLSFITTYNRDVYDFKMIDRLMNHFKQLINNSIDNPNTAIKDICLDILINDFYLGLKSVQSNQVIKLPEPQLYSNYIKWLMKIEYSNSLKYWKNYLFGYSNATEIPFKQLTSSSNEEIFNRRVEKLVIAEELYLKILRFCKKKNIEISVFMQTVWGYLLSKYYKNQDVVFGVVVSGMPANLHRMEEMEGLFINTVPVRIRYDLNETPLDLLLKIQKDYLEINKHHYVNLSEIQSEVGMNLINHSMVYENLPIQDLIVQKIGINKTDEDKDLILSAFNRYRQSNYDFEIALFPHPNSIILEFKYNGNTYETKSITLLMNQFYRLTKEFSSSYKTTFKNIDADFNHESAEKLKNQNRLKLSKIKQIKRNN